MAIEELRPRMGQMSRISNWDDLNNRPVVKSSSLFSFFFALLFPFSFLFWVPPSRSTESILWIKDEEHLIMD
jgi:hypothetical protein